MYIGLDEKNNRVTIYDAIQRGEGHSYRCPVCGEELIINRGGKYKPHFSHKSHCHEQNEDTSVWHDLFVSEFKDEYREVIVQVDIDELKYHYAKLDKNFGTWKNYDEQQNELKKLMVKKSGGNLETLHLFEKADVCIGKFVIMFRSVPISKKEFNYKTWFFKKAGYKLIWIFDMVESLGDIKWKDLGKEGAYYKKMYFWEHPKKIFVDFCPQKEKSILLFQTIRTNGKDLSEKNIFAHIIWAINKEKKGFSINDYSRFISKNDLSSLYKIKKYIDNYNKKCGIEAN